MGGARGLLGRVGADAVLGGGGYVAGPVGMAAVARRTPLVLSEADSHLGLANRLLAPFARRVCLAFPADLAVTSTKLVELRNPLADNTLRPPLLVFIPSDLRAACRGLFWSRYL